MKTSVDFDDELFLAFKAHCAGEGKTMTGVLEACMREVLRSAGKLPGDDVAEALARARELIQVRGLSAVQAKLDELALEEVARD